MDCVNQGWVNDDEGFKISYKTKGRRSVIEVRLALAIFLAL